jgi:predicted DNA-binding protein
MSDDLDNQTVNTDQIITVRVPNELNEKADAAARLLGLKKADVLRLSFDRGIEVLIAQLTGQALAGNVEGEAS